VLNTPFPPWPSFTAEESAAVQAVLASNRVNYWTGTECREFEREFAAWVGVPHAVALMNGTVALELALRALGIGPGDEVVVTPRTFIASISCVVSVGATPVFADVDPVSGNLTAATIEPVLTPKTKAIVCVHLAGWPCDMDPIMELARARGLRVIEDCAQAHGARYKGRSVGSIGDIGAWSFCQDKIMTTGGEGGMVTTRDEQLWRSMWEYEDHGKSFAAVYEKSHPPGFRWLHESFGSNWRMLEVQAAIGRVQLRHVEARVQKRNAHADALLADLPGDPGAACARVSLFGRSMRVGLFGGLRLSPCPLTNSTSTFGPRNWHLVRSRDSIIEALEARGVPCYQGTCSEVYRERAFDGTPWRPAAPLPVARELGETSLMFLVHPTLEKSQIEAACAAIREVFERET
jgi:dTDP-4-amino-4,6-dideoxygalactose transaminase